MKYERKKIEVMTEGSEFAIRESKALELVSYLGSTSALITPQRERILNTVPSVDTTLTSVEYCQDGT